MRYTLVLVTLLLAPNYTLAAEDLYQGGVAPLVDSDRLEHTYGAGAVLMPGQPVPPMDWKPPRPRQEPTPNYQDPYQNPYEDPYAVDKYKSPFAPSPYETPAYDSDPNKLTYPYSTR